MGTLDGESSEWETAKEIKHNKEKKSTICCHEDAWLVRIQRAKQPFTGSDDIKVVTGGATHLKT